MANSDQTRFAAYGAYQLKATYQRNMLWALGVVTGLVIFTVGLATILLGSPSAPPAKADSNDRPPVDTVVVQLDNKIPVIIPDGPPVSPRPPDPNAHSGSIPVPVPDSTVSEQPIDFSNISSGSDPVGSGIDFGGDGFGTSVGIVLDTAEVLPSMTDFVAVERQPELIYSVQPVYPRWVKEVGIEGMVVIKALVSRAGDVLDAVVYVTSGNKLLDEAALAVAGKYKYQPAVQNGRPVALWVTYNVEFKLAR